MGVGVGMGVGDWVWRLGRRGGLINVTLAVSVSISGAVSGIGLCVLSVLSVLCVSVLVERDRRGRMVLRRAASGGPPD